MAKNISRTPSGINTQQLNRNRRLQEQRRTQNQNEIHKDEMRDVQSDVSTTIGKGAKKSKEQAETKTPREKVNISGPDAQKAEETEKPKEDNSAKVEEKQRQEAEQQKAQAEQLSNNFTEGFTSHFEGEPQKGVELQQQTKESLENFAAEGKFPDPMKVLAAHTINHAQKSIKAKLPAGAKLKDAREAAKSDPSLAKDLKLLDSAMAFANAPTAEAKGAAAGNGASASNPNAPLSEDPFAVNRPGMSSEQGPPQGPGDGGPPGAGGDSGNPYHLSPEDQVQRMKEHNDMMRSIADIYNQMFQENRKAAAERHALMLETSNSIMDIYRSVHMNRVRSAEKHQQAYLALITGAL